MPNMDSLSHLNLTNEVDLLEKHPNIEYLFLPFDTSQLSPKENINNMIRVSHAPTNRFYKGSDFIISICEKLEQENKSHFCPKRPFPLAI